MSRTHEVPIGLEERERVTQPTFDQAKYDFLRRRKEHPIRSTLLLTDINDDRIRYNAIGAVIGGQFALIARVESANPDDEVSEIRKWDYVTTPAGTGSFLLNGLRQEGAQDPTLVQFSKRGDVALGYVSLQTDDPNKPGEITGYADRYCVMTADGQLTTTFINGPLGKKERRFAYVGANQTVFAPRIRDEDPKGNVTSFLQIFLEKTPSSFSGHEALLNRARDKRDEVEILANDDQTWIGTEQIIPQISPDPETVALAILTHGGHWRGEKQVVPGKKDTRNREYAAFMSEFLLSRKTGRMIHQEPTRMIASIEDIEDFPQARTPKREDLTQVIIGKGLVFGLNPKGRILQTILIGGAGDRIIPALDLPNPLKRPIDPRLNACWVLPISRMPQFFPNTNVKNVLTANVPQETVVFRRNLVAQ